MEKIKKTSLKQDIIITLLLQGINNISKTIAQKDEKDNFQVLKITLNKINEKLEGNYNLVNNLKPEEFKIKLDSLDNMVKLLQTGFNLLIKNLNDENKKSLKKEYKRLLNNLNDFRDDLETFNDVELWNEIKKINNGTYDRSNYIDI